MPAKPRAHTKYKYIKLELVTYYLHFFLWIYTIVVRRRKEVKGKKRVSVIIRFNLTFDSIKTGFFFCIAMPCHALCWMNFVFLFLFYSFFCFDLLGLVLKRFLSLFSRVLFCICNNSSSHTKNHPGIFCFCFFVTLCVFTHNVFFLAT